jgi:hypothetical protein
VLRWARDAADAHADALSIGVECKSWSGRFGNVWTSLIRDVRAVYPGLLTYSANWDEAENVLFWDQLDLVGINAFYPLADHNGASDQEYREGALRNAEIVRDLSDRLEMPILFVEKSATRRAPNAAIEPWLWPDGMENVVISEHEQARALDALFEAFLPEPWFAGFFVWRYYNNLDDVSQEGIWGFSPHAKQAEHVLRDAFAAPWASDPGSFVFDRVPAAWQTPLFPRRPHPLRRLRSAVLLLTPAWRVAHGGDAAPPTMSVTTPRPGLEHKHPRGRSCPARRRGTSRAASRTASRRKPRTARTSPADRP